MILSMTGYGSAQHVQDGVCYGLEIRSVNNRYLKLAIKLPESLQFAENAMEKLVRARLSRGTVSCTLRVRSAAEAAPAMNMAALQAYVDRLTGVRVPPGVQPTIDLAAVALLPGVADAPDMDDRVREDVLGIVRTLTTRGLDAVIEMRREEGRALRDELLACCDAIRTELATVAARSPNVVQEYHERLRTRVAALMQEGGFELEAEGLMREVAIYAERCDISEEVSRLTSHLDQFAEFGERGEQVGRTLDFLTQELLREANTVASKSNDAAIARSIVLIKGLIDRLKEQVQNVE